MKREQEGTSREEVELIHDMVKHAHLANVSYQDFALALKLLKVPMSAERWSVLRDCFVSSATA
ncbi:MAG: hypothetical protein HQL40_05925 [Alphaproteobacteria bacterium]|nr:hypothetical protein [Alphaproteobacteria bacterium]